MPLGGRGLGLMVGLLPSVTGVRQEKMGTHFFLHRLGPGCSFLSSFELCFQDVSAWASGSQPLLPCTQLSNMWPSCGLSSRWEGEQYLLVL